MKKPQTRVVLDPSEREKAQRILDQTGIKTFSQLFTLFLHNYGEHLVQSLKPPVQVSVHNPTTSLAPKPHGTLPVLRPDKTKSLPKNFAPMEI